MSNRNKISKSLKKRYNKFKNEGISRREIGRRLGVAESTLRSWEKSGKLDFTVGGTKKPLTEDKIGVDTDELDSPITKIMESSFQELGILDELCKDDDKDIASLAKRLRTAQRNLAQQRKIVRKAQDVEEFRDNLLEGINEACSNIGKNKVKIKSKKAKGKRLTAELLFSDLQIGKLMKNYNSDIAKRRVEEYARVTITKIKQHQANGYVFDRIILALLGDIFEADEKHHNSARSCDSSTAEQMKNAQEVIFNCLIDPLAELGIPLDCICITGNHDWNGHGLNMFKPGLNQLSYPLFHALRMVSEAKGYSHLSFIIPEGCFHIDDIYGFKVLYEHGVGVATAEAAMSKRKHQRSDQIRELITYFRMGDKHNISRFNEDTHVINGAFFGGDDTGGEYSSICGYASDPAQLILFHTPRIDDRLSVYDSLIIQLKHIK